jgi:hypothetical protein
MNFIETNRKGVEKSLAQAGKLRKSLEHGSNIPSGISPDFFVRFPPEECKKLIEIYWKNSETFHLEYCFHVPAISGVFLPEPVRTL